MQIKKLRRSQKEYRLRNIGRTKKTDQKDYEAIVLKRSTAQGNLTIFTDYAKNFQKKLKKKFANLNKLLQFCIAESLRGRNATQNLFHRLVRGCAIL